MLIPFLGANSQIHALGLCSSFKLPLSENPSWALRWVSMGASDSPWQLHMQYLSSLLDYSLPRVKTGTSSSHSCPSALSTDSNLKACHVSQNFLSQHPLISREGSIHPVGNKSLLFIALIYLKLFLKHNNGLYFIVQPVKSLEIFAKDISSLCSNNKLR